MTSNSFLYFSSGPFLLLSFSLCLSSLPSCTGWNLFISSPHLLHTPFFLFFSPTHFFLPPLCPNPTHDRDPNTSPPQQHTTSLPRLSSGRSTVAGTLWEWRGSQGARPVTWNTAVVGYHGLPGGTCSIFLQHFLATVWDGSMVLIVLPTMLAVNRIW